MVGLERGVEWLVESVGLSGYVFYPRAYSPAPDGGVATYVTPTASPDPTCHRALGASVMKRWGLGCGVQGLGIWRVVVRGSGFGIQASGFWDAGS